MEVFFGLLTFIIISIAFSHMWSHSKILGPVRNIIARIPYIRVPLLCPECSSFWVGFAVSWIYNPFFGIPILGTIVLSNVVLGLVTHLFADPLYKKEILEGFSLDDNTDFEE